MSARSILFVEDEELLREIVVEALEDEGYRVQAATDGPAALALLAGPAHFDALITDVSMPNGVSGVDVARIAKEVRPALVVVLVSGYAKAQLPPIPPSTPFLPKPYRLTELTGLLASLWGGAAAAGSQAQARG